MIKSGWKYLVHVDRKSGKLMLEFYLILKRELIPATDGSIGQKFRAFGTTIVIVLIISLLFFINQWSGAEQEKLILQLDDMRESPYRSLSMGAAHGSNGEAYFNLESIDCENHSVKNDNTLCYWQSLNWSSVCDAIGACNSITTINNSIEQSLMWKGLPIRKVVPFIKSNYQFLKKNSNTMYSARKKGYAFVYGETLTENLDKRWHDNSFFEKIEYESALTSTKLTSSINSQLGIIVSRRMLNDLGWTNEESPKSLVLCIKNTEINNALADCEESSENINVDLKIPILAIAKKLPFQSDFIMSYEFAKYMEGPFFNTLHNSIKVLIPILDKNNIISLAKELDNICYESSSNLNFRCVEDSLEEVGKNNDYFRLFFKADKLSIQDILSELNHILTYVPLWQPIFPTKIKSPSFTGALFYLHYDFFSNNLEVKPNLYRLAEFIRTKDIYLRGDILEQLNAALEVLVLLDELKKVMNYLVYLLIIILLLIHWLALNQRINHIGIQFWLGVSKWKIMFASFVAGIIVATFASSIALGGLLGFGIPFMVHEFLVFLVLIMILNGSFQMFFSGLHLFRNDKHPLSLTDYSL